MNNSSYDILHTPSSYTPTPDLPGFPIESPIENLEENEARELDKVSDKESRTQEGLNNSAKKVKRLSRFLKNEPKQYPLNHLKISQEIGKDNQKLKDDLEIPLSLKNLKITEESSFISGSLSEDIHLKKSSTVCPSKKGDEKSTKIKKSRSLNIGASFSLSKDEEKTTRKKSNVRSLGSSLEAIPLKDKEKFTEKKDKRKSLELSIEGSWLKGKQRQMFLQTLGVLDHTAVPDLQTNAFHVLKLNDLISSSEKLEDIKICLKEHESFIGFKSLVDLAFKEEDASFFQLLKYAKKKNKIDLIGGSFANNYPNFEANQINCDCFHAEKHSNYSFSVLADGCGLGIKSRKAAQRAVIAATQFINQMLGHFPQLVQTAENIAWVLIQSIAMAHEAIVSFEESSDKMGTTTLNICFAFMTPQGKKYLMVAGVGDCKAFLATQDLSNQYQVVDISSSKRLNLDIRDPGGRIGPYSRVKQKYVDPDLRNLSLVCIPLPEGESIIFNMSDGVHDNFIPYQYGMKPCEVDSNLPSSTQWSDLSEFTQQALENIFQNDCLSRLINEITKKDKINKDKINLDGICEGLTHYCNQLTSPSRTFMEKNPTQYDPEDKKEYPGKMDHCSVVAFVV